MPSVRSDFSALRRWLSESSFFLHVIAQGVEPLGHVFAQCFHCFRYGVFQAREALLVVAHLRAEQYVAYLVYVGAFRAVLAG